MEIYIRKDGMETRNSIKFVHTVVKLEITIDTMQPYINTNSNDIIIALFYHMLPNYLCSAMI